MAKATMKKAAAKAPKKVAHNHKQTVTGSSTNLNLEEALNDAVGKLAPPGPGSDVVSCVIEKLEVSRGGIADLRILTVTLVSK